VDAARAAGEDASVTPERWGYTNPEIAIRAAVTEN